MKKYCQILLAAGTLFLVSCSGGGGLSAKAKKNKEVNTAIMKAYESGDFSKMSEYMAADAIDHGGEMGDVKGLENIIAEMKKYREMMPDMKSTVIHEMADDEYVMTWAKFTGTMDGKLTTMTSADITKFKDGKAIEHWVFMDPREMAAMMAPGQPMDNSQEPAKDTAR
jgi:predicted SnoaL-like aldol condensation-catalyzing enzyme